ncbi:MAG TPA: extracellular solute-binding protein [Candidatus Sumerlaeota bacterium]|nr:extracellular solute-binding protein [Candidatus Sumerlaeota bacterium]
MPISKPVTDARRRRAGAAFRAGRWIALAALLPALILLGCGPRTEPGTSTAAAPTGGTATPRPTAEATRLVIVSPHNEFIRQEFERGFQRWYAERRGGAPAVEFEWQDRGGTYQMVEAIAGAYQALDDKDDGMGVDLVWGGGIEAMEQLKAAGATTAAALPQPVLDSLPAEIAGVRLYDPDGHWYGAVLSSFGIIYNKEVLRTLGVAAPATWSDLSNPALFGHIVLADPSKSGSARVAFEVILQKHGWAEGWALLMEIAGNTREFTDSASNVPSEVAQGSAAAGMSIDFYAFSQIESTGAEMLGYVSPVNATALTPDPICMLRGGPNPAAAEAFMEFVLTKPGQSLWLLKPGTPGGPAEHGLWRMPILPAAYEHPADQRLIDFNPYASETTFNLDMDLSTRRSPLLGPLFMAAFLRNSELLRQAWRKVMTLPADAPLRRQFNAVPFSEEEALDLARRYQASPREASQLEIDWQRRFRARYEQVLNAE